MSDYTEVDRDFYKKFVIRTGTKKVERVGYYVTDDPMSHVGHDPKLVLDFIHLKITEARQDERRKIVEKIRKDVRKQIQGKIETINGETFVMGEDKNQHIWNQALSNVEAIISSLTGEKGE